MKGPDHKASLEPKEFKQMVSKINIEKAIGRFEKKPTKSELITRHLVRQSIHAKKYSKREKFTPKI